VIVTVIVAEPHRVHQAAVGFPRAAGSSRGTAGGRSGRIVAGRRRWGCVVSSSAGSGRRTMRGLGPCRRRIGVAALFALEL
jgi:hypothetical protein